MDQRLICQLLLCDERPNRNQQIKGYLIFGAFAGAAFLTKGFVGLALLVIAIVPFMIITRQLKQLLIYGWLALLAAVCVTLPWSIAVAIKAPDYWNFFFWNENIRRFSSEHAQHIAPVWYYIPCLILTLLPWTILAPKAIMAKFSRASSATVLPLPGLLFYSAISFTVYCQR
ncbi:phospholipid carrier-dependent glycosyltransferase [Vibrio sp. PP-XX7]